MERRQMFGEGDIVMTRDGFKCKVLMPILDENEGWFYEVEPVDMATFPREVPQDFLEGVEE